MDHVVLLKWKEGTEVEKVLRAIDALKGMVGKVDAVESVRVGATITDRSKGWTHAIIVRLNVSTKEGLVSKYSKHPVHAKLVKDFLSEHLDDIMAVDINEEEVKRESSSLSGWPALLLAAGAGIAVGYLLQGLTSSR